MQDISNITDATMQGVDEEKWYQTTLPISLTIILAVILLILCIVRIVQCCQERRTKRLSKKAKERRHLREESEWRCGERGVEAEAETEAEGSKVLKSMKQQKLIKFSKHKEADATSDVPPIVPTNENGSLFQSRIRPHPTRKKKNESWYDSKVIRFIDDGEASLDNLYLPSKAILEVV